MNNSQFSIEQFNVQPEKDKTPWLKDQESSLKRIIETLRRVAGSEDWSSLKNLLWDDVVETLERQQKSEAEQDKPDPHLLAKINGQLVWARKYSDLNKLADFFMVQLKGVKNQLDK